MDDYLSAEISWLLHRFTEAASKIEEFERRHRRKKRSTNEQLPESRGLGDNVIEDGIPRPNEVSTETPSTSSASTLTTLSVSELDSLQASPSLLGKRIREGEEREEQTLQSKRLKSE